MSIYNVGTVGEFVASGNQKLTNLVYTCASNGPRKIPDGFCQNCKNLSGITHSNNITAIGNSAFLYCDKLSTSFTIGSGYLTKIGSYAFGGTSMEYGKHSYVVFRALDGVNTTDTYSYYPAVAKGSDSISFFRNFKKK